ncbi:glycosyltransferase family 2 protein [Mediterraneibacter gnavus]|uniref:glycosyltransferase family 2 protein n=1 Tax=Mediterraneibacter gnavus TaxID=33038 RepID=UPI00356459E9
MSKINVSIIIPIYKIKLDYLKICLESCVNQVKANIEIICIIDGYDKQIEDMCRNYGSKYNNFRYYIQENQGVSVSRNKGIELSEGEYVCFVDADDWIDPLYCYNLYSFAFANNLDYVVSGYKEKYVNADMIKDIKIEQNVVQKVNDEFIITNFFRPDHSKLNLNFNSPWAKLFSRKFLNHNNIYFDTDMKYGEDLLFNFTSIFLVEKMGMIQDSGYNYRIRKDAITNSAIEKIIEYKNKLLKQMILLANEHKNKEELVDNILISNFFFAKSILLTTKCDLQSVRLLKKFFDNSYDSLKDMLIFDNTKKDKIIRNCPCSFWYIIQRIKFKNDEKIKFN